MLEPGTSPPCPWCGAAAERNVSRHGTIIWECDTTQIGEHIDQSNACKIAALESANAAMRELLGDILAGSTVHHMHRQRIRELLNAKQ